ncbi:MAG: lipoyl(octanoyl) transferase LipB, partial [Acidobacteria bacterium]|nr:lipoyl(octanoyl) transferase LipB [Acidobacteriota bacterium]
MTSSTALRVRWLGRVPYSEAYSVQRAMYTHGVENHLLLLEHPHTYTLGARADPANILIDPAAIGVQVIETDRGGDVTYHGPGQLVGYPILWAPGGRGGGMADTAAYVCSVEQLVIDALTDLGLSDVGRLEHYPGVWVAPDSESPRKIAAIGVRLSRGRTMHGFAVNVDPDMTYFDHIVPCGITDKAVTSLALEGVDVDMAAVADAVALRAKA